MVAVVCGAEGVLYVLVDYVYEAWFGGASVSRSIVFSEDHTVHEISLANGAHGWSGSDHSTGELLGDIPDIMEQLVKATSRYELVVLRHEKQYLEIPGQHARVGGRLYRVIVISRYPFSVRVVTRLRDPCGGRTIVREEVVSAQKKSLSEVFRTVFYE